MVDIPKLMAMIAAVMLNTALISLLALFANHGSLFGDLQFWLLLFLANGFLIVEAQLNRTEQPSNTSLDDSARRLALASSVALLGIYWCAFAGRTSTLLWVTSAGSLMFIAGVLLRAVAIGQLGVHFRSDVSIHGHHRLVRNGIYRCLRHPSETGLLLVGLGAAVMFSSLPAFAVWLCVLTPLTLQRISLEERCLLKAFGENYRKYARHTGGLLPRK